MKEKERMIRKHCRQRKKEIQKRIRDKERETGSEWDTERRRNTWSKICRKKKRERKRKKKRDRHIRKKI